MQIVTPARFVTALARLKLSISPVLMEIDGSPVPKNPGLLRLAMVATCTVFAVAFILNVPVMTDFPVPGA